MKDQQKLDVLETEMVLWRREKIAILNMLIRRATKEDYDLAKAKPGHWLNQARREVEPRL